MKVIIDHESVAVLSTLIGNDEKRKTAVFNVLRYLISNELNLPGEIDPPGDTVDRELENKALFSEELLKVLEDISSTVAEMIYTTTDFDEDTLEIAEIKTWSISDTLFEVIVDIKPKLESTDNEEEESVDEEDDVIEEDDD